MRNDGTQVSTWNIVECYAGVCEQRIRHIQGIVILQSRRTKPWYKHALRTLHGGDFLNIAPLEKDSMAACSIYRNT
jgi:hypothetical protein